jgi:hypothetical protein
VDKPSKQHYPDINVDYFRVLTKDYHSLLMVFRLEFLFLFGGNVAKVKLAQLELKVGNKQTK